MADEKTKLMSEREELEMEVLRAQVLKMRNDKESKVSARADQELALRETEAKMVAMQGSCNHKKGGRDYASQQKQGDGENHSVFKHTGPLGVTLVLCSRCLFMWLPGTTEKLMPDKVTHNPTGISYHTAIRFPSDNTPSGSVLFGHRPQPIAA